MTITLHERFYVTDMGIAGHRSSGTVFVRAAGTLGNDENLRFVVGSEHAKRFSLGTNIDIVIHDDSPDSSS